MLQMDVLTSTWIFTQAECLSLQSLISIQIEIENDKSYKNIILILVHHLKKKG